jgi:predicted small secreted protein
MNKTSIILLGALSAASVSLFLTGCNTVQGAFQGAGQDTKAVVRGLHLENPPARHHTSYKKTTVKSSTTTAKTGTAATTTTTTTTTAQ